MRTSRKLASLMAITACAALTALVPAAASADTYGPAEAGYTGSVVNDGLCIPPVVCPLITNSVQGSGGADGGNYLRSSLLAVATTELTTNNAIWTSAPFTYNGNGGVRPAVVNFDMFRRADVDALLGVDVLNRATYQVDLINNTTNGVIQITGPNALAGATNWEATPSVGVNPGLLTIGHSYSLRITSTFKTAAAVLVMGGADYDIVRLSTAGQSAGGPGDGTGQYGNPYGALSALSGFKACVKNAKKKIKKRKISAKKKKRVLKKKRITCAKKFKVKIKKVKKKKRR